MSAKEWERLNAVFQDALAKYPYSQHALHYLWNNAIATGPETFKPPPAPPSFLPHQQNTTQEKT